MAPDRHDPDEAVLRSAESERAVELFARLLESGDDPLHPDRARFDDLLRRHPELRDELLRIRDGMEKFESVRRRLPRIALAKGGRRWRWVGGGLAAAGVVALATFLIMKERAPQPRGASPIATSPAPRAAADVELIAVVRDQLIEAGMRSLDGVVKDLQLLTRSLPSTPVPDPAAPNVPDRVTKEEPDPLVVERGDRMVEQFASVVATMQKIEEIHRDGATGTETVRRDRIQDVVAQAPQPWRSRLESASANPEGSISDAAPLLLALTRDPKLQALLLAKQKDSDLPQVLKELSAAATAPAQLSVKAIDLDHGAVEITGATVFVQSIDPVTGLLGQPAALGETPLPGVALVAGDWRITVVDSTAAEARHSELRLLAMPNEELAPRVAFFRATPDPGKSMALQPATSFHFGAPPDAKFTSMSHLPLSTESIAEFWIDRDEVTCQEYSDFYLEAQRHPDWFGGSVPLHRPRVLASDGTCPAQLARAPIVDVTWEEAVIYANWAGKRLPTEREWERAARGSLAEDRTYPWGDVFAPAGKRCVNLSASLSYSLNPATAGSEPPKIIQAGRPDQKFLTLVGSDVDDPAYADGATPGRPAAHLQRMADNAAEFVEDLYVEMRGSTPGLLRSASVARVVKGASWLTIDPANCTNWSRSSLFPDCSLATNGFRCAMTSKPFTATK